MPTGGDESRSLMGINGGALLGPLNCGALRINLGWHWHWRFAAAAIGMIEALIVYRATQKPLGEFGLEPQPTPPEQQRQTNWMRNLISAVIAGLFAVAFLSL